MDDVIKREIAYCVKVGTEVGFDAGFALGFAAGATVLGVLGHYYASAIFALCAASSAIRARAMFRAIQAARAV